MSDEDMIFELSPHPYLIVHQIFEGRNYSGIGAEFEISEQVVHKVSQTALQSAREKLPDRGFSDVLSKGFLKSAAVISHAALIGA
jgi:DNA-directed RNA polymerase specialized sigma24 family protein